MCIQNSVAYSMHRARVNGFLYTRQLLLGFDMGFSVLHFKDLATEGDAQAASYAGVLVDLYYHNITYTIFAVDK